MRSFIYLFVLQVRHCENRHSFQVHPSQGYSECEMKLKRTSLQKCGNRVSTFATQHPAFNRRKWLGISHPSYLLTLGGILYPLQSLIDTKYKVLGLLSKGMSLFPANVTSHFQTVF